MRLVLPVFTIAVHGFRYKSPMPMNPSLGHSSAKESAGPFVNRVGNAPFYFKMPAKILVRCIRLLLLATRKPMPQLQKNPHP